MTKPVLIIDSSPLITLSLFPVHTPAIQTILEIADVIIVETVAQEITGNLTHRDAVIVKKMLDTQQIKQLPVTRTKVDEFIDAYGKIDAGERDTIKLAISTSHTYLVIDDVYAFVVAAHFDLKPVMLLDLLALWAGEGLINKTNALKIVNAVASRYSEVFVNHTRYKLGEVTHE